MPEYENAFDEAYYERCTDSVARACQALQTVLAFGSFGDAFHFMKREEQVACIYRLAEEL